MKVLLAGGGTGGHINPALAIAAIIRQHRPDTEFLFAGTPNHMEAKLIPQSLIEPVQKTKTEYLGARNPRLHTDEVLVALSVLSQTDEQCRRALEQLPRLRGCQVHSTVMLSEVDRKIFKKLGCGLTCDPVKKK